MGLVNRLARWYLRHESAQGDWFSFLRQNAQTRSGTRVDRESAIQLALLLACLQVKCETVGALPCALFHASRDENGIKTLEPATSRPLYRALAIAPNPYMTPPEFFARMVLDLELFGNFYADIRYDRSGRLRGLYPLAPKDVLPFWVDQPYTYAYRVNLPEGGEKQTHRKERVYLPGEILHVRSNAYSEMDTYDGICGTGLLHTQKETLGLSIDARNFASDLFANSALPSAVIKVRGALSKEQQKQTREAWEATYGRDSKGAGRIGFLGADSEFVPVSMRPLDAQFYENRTAADADIPRITGVPAFLVGLPSNATYNNTEQQVRAFHSGCIGPLTKRIEAALSRDLIVPSERGRLEIRVDLEGLLRGDITTRTKFYGEAVRLGVLNPNEVREMEGKNPREGGDEYAELPEKNAEGPSEQGQGANAPQG